MKLLLLGKTTLLGYTLGILLVMIWMTGSSTPVRNSMLQARKEELLFEQNTKSLTYLSNSDPNIHQYNDNTQEIGSQIHAETSGEKTPMTSSQTKLCTQETRKRHISDMCHLAHQNITWEKSRFMVDERRKLFFCEISKSGCTTWKALWQHANNPNQTLEYYSKDPMMVHSFGHLWAQTHLTQKRPPVTDIHNYTSFLVVRHPFERLLSAFYNIKKFVKKEPGPDPQFREHLSKTFNLTMKYSIPKLEMRQFVEYITDRQLSKKYYYDRHIVPYSQTCGICNISYDYILRLETSQDAKPMLNLLGYTENSNIIQTFMINKKRQVDTDDEGNRYMKEFKNLPRKLLLNLLDRYRYDLQIFGYHYDIQTTKAWCAIQSDNGEICC